MSKPKPESKVVRKVQKNALRVLEIETLKVDRSYQRGLTKNGSKKIAEHYDPVAFGIPLVGERYDGTLWVVDGQQRIEALKLRGGHRWARCEVFASDGPEHEASVFKIVNKDRVSLKPLQLFHAMLTAGDEHCWELKRLVEKWGFRIPKGESGGEADSPEQRSTRIGAINTASGILFRGGADAINFVLETLSKVWPDDALRTKNQILHGLYIFWKNHEKVVDMDRLVPRLMSTTPSKVLYSASMGVDDASRNTAAVFERLYAKRSVGPGTGKKPTQSSGE